MSKVKNEGVQVRKVFETGAFSSDCVVEVVKKENQGRFRFIFNKEMLKNKSTRLKKVLETQNAQLIKINNVKPHIMEHVQKHIYGCKLQYLTGNNLQDLVMAAKKYGIVTLSNECAKYILKRISPVNALFFLDLWKNMIPTKISQQLETKLIQVIKENTIKCITGKNKENISEDTLVKLLEMRDLNVKREMDLIKFVNRWAIFKVKKEENLENVEYINLRKLIKPRILPLIHFLAVNRDEFFHLLRLTNWLNVEEKVALFDIIVHDTPLTKYPSYLSRCRVSRYSTRYGASSTCCATSSTNYVARSTRNGANSTVSARKGYRNLHPRLKR